MLLLHFLLQIQNVILFSLHIYAATNSVCYIQIETEAFGSKLSFNVKSGQKGRGNIPEEQYPNQQK